jgi:two-component system, NarL family, nitrate/nitrite response regulator NarL
VRYLFSSGTFFATITLFPHRGGKSALLMGLHSSWHCSPYSASFWASCNFQEDQVRKQSVGMETLSQQSIRVVIIDPKALIRAGLVRIIDEQPDMLVVGDSGQCDEGMELVEAQQPDIILLKLAPTCDLSPDCIPALLRKSKRSRIILLSLPEEDEQLTIRGIEQGALGVVCKSESAAVLIKAIRKVHEGEVWIERSLVADFIHSVSHTHEPQPLDPEEKAILELTDREIDVIKLIGRGYKNQQIAEQLCLSESTIRHHLTSIYHKLGVASRLELLVFANSHDIV